MNALEMALEALENPSTIATMHAIYLLRKAVKPYLYFHPDLLQTSTYSQKGYIPLYRIDNEN